MSQEVKFEGEIIRCIYNGDDFKVYAVYVDEDNYPNLKHNKYGNVAICGNLHTLTLNTRYQIEAVEEHNKNGYSYKVNNIKCDKPSSSIDMQLFLSEILTPQQADTLYQAYPDIVDKVIKDDLDDVDLNKTKGIKEYTFNIIKQKIIENFCLVEIVSEFKGLISLNIVKKLYDKYPSVEKIRSEIKNNPYKCLCGLARVGFKTADSLILSLDEESKELIKKGEKPIIDFGFDLKTSEQRCLACALYLLEENEANGHTNMDVLELKHQVEKLVPACEDKLKDVIQDKNIYLNKETREVALTETYLKEAYIALNILKGLQTNIVWDFDVDKYKDSGEFPLSDEQMGAFKLLCEKNISILNGSAGCVDMDTEFFNGTEWKKISEYNENDMVLQYNEDGSAELVKPLDYIKQPSEYLWHFETKYGLDQCLSDNHTVVYKTSRGNIKRKLFSEIIEMHNKNGFTGKFMTSFKYNGTGIDLSDDKIRLMIAIFADGAFYNKSTEDSDSFYTVRMRLKKQRKKDRLEDLLNRMNKKYRKEESATDGYNDYYFEAPFRCKKYPKEWFNCSKHQLEIIADEVMNWDGEYNNQNNYSTTIKDDADFIQWVFTSLGYRTTITTYDRIGQEYLTCGKLYTRKSIEYSVKYTNRNEIGLCVDHRTNREMTKIIPYKTIDGYEYCFTVPSHMLVLRRNNKIFITGNCGKSATTQNIIKMLDDNNKTYRLISPTGKAAKVLSEYTGKDAKTIHRGLGYMPPNEWLYNKECKLTCDVLIIDEFSMVDVDLFTHVIDAIDFEKTKLLMIGDNAQLSSVGCGNLLHDFMYSNIIPTTTLTKVFRYGKGGLMTVATDARNCKKYLTKDMETCTFFGDNKDFAFINLDDTAIIKNITGLYKKLLSQGYTSSDIQILSSYKKGEYGSININNHIQSIANPNCNTEGIKYGEITYYKGDIVIQNINNYHAEIYIDGKMEIDDKIDNDKFDNGKFDKSAKETFIANGETGVIIEILGQHDMVIDFDGVKVKYNRDSMSTISLGYSISIHKSQGSASKVIILVTPKAHTFMLNSNLIYVGLTRMREKCFQLGNIDTVNASIKKKENLNRKTFMQGLLKIKLEPKSEENK